jgi:hypothetical protein
VSPARVRRLAVTRRIEDPEGLIGSWSSPKLPAAGTIEAQAWSQSNQVNAGAIMAVLVSDSRRLVYVSGAPGSGKTSLAVPLAAELGYALLSKDRIKETLYDALGAPAPDRAWSRMLGGAAMELLWALAADAPAAVIEANFRSYSE